MSSAFDVLLDATIHHLQELKQQGTEFVSVDATLLAELSKPGKATARVGVENSKAVAPVAVRPTVEVTRISAAPEMGPAISAKADTRTDAEREAAMAELRCRVLQCQKCPNLVSSRKNVVFGVGTIHTDLMFVGEAPGADEDVQGEPFVGAAGQLLTKIIQTMGCSRQTVYIANILKCRPDTPGQSFGNRKPTPAEMSTCLPYLLEQIDIIRPKVIVALGATAMEGLFGKAVYITKIRGQWHTFREIPVMPTYHPAYLLRNQALAEKRKVWEDMLQVLEKLGRPISEKQRGYFLKGS